MPTAILTKDRSTAPPTTPTIAQRRQLGEWTRDHGKRLRRLKLNAAAWAFGTVVFTALWIVNQWQAHGSFQHFGNSGNPGDWNPTLLAVGVGIWALVVGIMALGVHFHRPMFDRGAHRIRQLRFHLAAWALGMIVLTPIWALIEWQDNGGFARWSDNGQRGSWEPWILYVGGIWLLAAIVFSAARLFFDRPPTEGDIDRELRRLLRRG